MAKSLKDLIEEALEDLEEESLKKFKRKLNEVQPEAGYNRIPRGKLEKADRMDIADHIVSYYLQQYGLSITLQVLEAINEKGVAESLRTNAAAADGASGSTVSVPPPTRSSREGAGAGPRPAGQHFVDQHRQQIISRTTLVEPIIDHLLSAGLLTDEQYERVGTRDTIQNKMRELYSFERGWGEGDKDEFYRALETHNPPLVRDLERQ
ncbi:apoptosis-associated speck-like protein containing a CARD isoform X1 [Ambystoma mexicanum]|uniref:apoptosis-associated speck-like protein containing a CARD isoform X1 n=1 Tax=Ambystoma mexicanum TaxID=8296 RepID=UPI0037E81478